MPDKTAVFGPAFARTFWIFAAPQKFFLAFPMGEHGFVPSFGDNLEQANSFGSPKIALLIDFDNVILGLDDPGFDVELVVNALRERGQIVLGRCYGDWYRHNRHRRKLMEHGLELVETPAFGPIIKNSADIRIALDGYEIGMTQHHIDTFCIVSGDSDFLPLIKKLQFLGKKVLVICGNRFTSDMVRRNCNEFIAYENLLAASVGALEDATTLEGSFSLLHRAMAALREAGRDIRTSTLKQMMLQLNPIFSERSLGCSQFRFFLDKAVARNLIKYGPRDRISGELHVLLPEEDEGPLAEKVESRGESRPESNRAESGRRFGRQAERETSRAEENAKVEVVKLEATSVETASETPIVEVENLAPEKIEKTERAPRFEAKPNGEDLAFPPRYDRNARRANRRYGADPLPSANEIAPAPRAEFAPETVIFSDPELEIIADAPSPEDVAEHLLTRTELIARGLRPGTRKFSAKSTAPSETPAEAATAPEPEIGAEAEVTEEPKAKRSRSRRKKSKVETPEIEASPETEATPAIEVAPESGEAPTVEATPEPIVETAPEIVAAVEAIEETPAPVEVVEEAPAKPKATRRRTTKKAPVEAPIVESAPIEVAPVELVVETPTDEAPAPKKPRARRSTKKAAE